MQRAAGSLETPSNNNLVDGTKFRETILPSMEDRMSGVRYRAFTKAKFEAIMAQMGFAEVLVPGAYEHVYQRVVHNGPHPSNRYSVRIFSTVDMRSGVSREVGGDAIRIMLHDSQLDRPVVDWTVHRTVSAFDNLRARAKQAWGYVMKPEHHCPSCGSMMVVRKAAQRSFLGCTSFPKCKSTRVVVQRAA